jgi:hypothetical protein
VLRNLDRSAAAKPHHAFASNKGLIPIAQMEPMQSRMRHYHGFEHHVVLVESERLQRSKNESSGPTRCRKSSICQRVNRPMRIVCARTDSIANLSLVLIHLGAAVFVWPSRPPSFTLGLDPVAGHAVSVDVLARIYMASM